MSRASRAETASSHDLANQKSAAASEGPRRKTPSRRSRSLALHSRARRPLITLQLSRPTPEAMPAQEGTAVAWRANATKTFLTVEAYCNLANLKAHSTSIAPTQTHEDLSGA